MQVHPWRRYYCPTSKIPRPRRTDLSTGKIVTEVLTPGPDPGSSRSLIKPAIYFLACPNGFLRAIHGRILLCKTARFATARSPSP